MMIDKETYFLKKMKSQILKIFLLVEKSEETVIKDMKTGSDLSVSEMHTLMAIGRKQPKPMSEVAADLMVSVSTLSIAISKLEKRNYVRRVRNNSDRRVVKVGLTARGKRAVDEHEQFYFKIIGEYIHDMDETEKKETVRTLDHIQRQLIDRFSSTGQRLKEDRA